MANTNGGTALITADSAVGTSGSPTRVYGIHVISNGTAGAIVSLKNGTSASGTTYVTSTGTTSTGITTNFGDVGMFFPGGCFVDVDANTVSVAVTYVQ